MVSFSSFPWTQGTAPRAAAWRARCRDARLERRGGSGDDGEAEGGAAGGGKTRAPGRMMKVGWYDLIYYIYIYIYNVKSTIEKGFPP